VPGGATIFFRNSFNYRRLDEALNIEVVLKAVHNMLIKVECL